MDKDKQRQLFELIRKAAKLMPEALEEKGHNVLLIDCFAKVDWMWEYMNAALSTAVSRKKIHESGRTYTLDEFKKELGL